MITPRCMRVSLVTAVMMAFAAGCTVSVEIDEDSPADVEPLDTGLISRIVGIEGTENNGEYKIGVPQTNLHVTVDGFRIVPRMGLTSWAAFTPAPDGAMVMGDMVLLEDEIGPVQQTLLKAGIGVTAIHNHFVRDTPKVMFMHIHGMGDTEDLARGVRAGLDRIAELRAAKGLSDQPAIVESNLDTGPFDSIIGHSGQSSGGVHKIALGRPDIDLRDHGVRVSTFLGFNTWIALQGTDERAAVAGDFTMLTEEVAPVIRTLAEHNIEVVAVHNHMISEDPRIFFLHYWGVGPATDLARGLRAALDQTGG